MAGKDPERPGGQTGDGASHRVRRHGDTTLPTRPVQAERQSTDRGSPPGSVDGFAPPDCAGAPGGSGGNLAALVDRICFAVCNAHDTSELWVHAKRDPEVFRSAVRFALGLDRPLEIHANDAELVRRAVESIGAGSHTRAPRWSHVGKVFGLGSTSSWKLCKRLGFDPDEDRGGCSVCGCSLEMIDGEPCCGCDAEQDHTKETP